MKLAVKWLGSYRRWAFFAFVVGMVGQGNLSFGLVIIDDPSLPGYGSPTANTSAPVGFGYWSNIFGDKIYVGNGRYLTANHSGSPVGISWTQLKYASGSAINSDIMVGTGSDLGKPIVPIITSPVAVNESLLIVGDGRYRDPNLTYWDITYVAGANNDIWTEGADPANAEAVGFKVTGGGKRWGTNEVAVTAVDVEFSGPVRKTRMFATSFSGTGGTEWEAQGSNNDSDGVVFVFRGGQWQLAGLMHAVGGIDESQDPIPLIGFDNHPNGGGSSLAALIEYQSSAINGDPVGTYTSATFFSELSFYNDQLLSSGFAFALPEPSSLVILVLGAWGGWGMVGGRTRRWGRR